MMTWVITAVLTIIAALSYGELAAAMPMRAGNMFILREAFGPIWGSLWLDAVSGNSNRHGRRQSQWLSQSITGVFFPSISADNWILPLSIPSSFSRS